LNIAGVDITNYLGQLLNEHHDIAVGANDRNDLTYIKENLCAVAPSAQTEDNSKSNYISPSGKTYRIGFEKHRCVEILFELKLIGHLILFSF
jgi:hypothetical protein